jgi:hypothetical protein
MWVDVNPMCFYENLSFRVKAGSLVKSTRLLEKELLAQFFILEKINWN